MANFGQATTIITAATIDAALSAYSAKKMGKLQAKFSKQLTSDAIKMEYVRYLVDRFRTLNEMLVTTTDHDPYSIAYEALLRQGMAEFMKYEGNCACTLYDPSTKNAVAKFTRDGKIENSQGMPPETAVIWATGCKNALDFARSANLQEQRERNQFQLVKTQKYDLQTEELFLRFGMGVSLFFAIIILIRVQRRLLKTKRQKANRKPRK